MPKHTLIRLMALLIVAASFAILSTEAWLRIFISISSGHYFISLLYSKRQILQVTGRPRRWGPLLSLMLLGTGLYFGGFPLFFVFGFHHAFNEVFMLERTVPAVNDQFIRKLRMSSLVLHLLVYFFVLRTEYSFSYSQRLGMALGLAASYTIFFYFLYRLRALLTVRQIIDNCSFEIIGAVMVAASFFTRFSLLQFIFYHVAFWVLFPVPGILKQGTEKFARYVGLTVVVTGIFFIMALFWVHEGDGDGNLYWRQFYFWSYFHITVSLALSSANPEWVNRLFRPQLSRPVARSAALHGVAPVVISSYSTNDG